MEQAQVLTFLNNENRDLLFIIICNFDTFLCRINK